MSRSMMEGLEKRAMFAADSTPAWHPALPFTPENPPIVPGSGGVVGFGFTGNDPASAGVDANFGTRNHGTVIINGNSVQIWGGGRYGNFTMPTIRSDGSINIAGSSDADQISVTRVTGLPDFDLNNITELRSVSFLTDGQRQAASGGISATSSAKLLADGQKRLADAQARLDAQTDDGSEHYRYYVDDVEQQQKFVDAWAIQADAAANATFIRCTLAGVYDYFIQVDPGTIAAARLNVDAGAGTDVVTIGSNVPMRANLIGGAGSDTLTSGKRFTAMSGGSGNDRLVSRSIQGGTLDGGKGSDRYYNRSTAVGTAGEVHVLARNDGDRVIVNNTNVPVVSAGIFGKSAIDKENYYLVEGSAGQVDLLSR